MLPFTQTQRGRPIKQKDLGQDWLRVRRLKLDAFILYHKGTLKSSKIYVSTPHLLHAAGFLSGPSLEILLKLNALQKYMQQSGIIRTSLFTSLYREFINQGTKPDQPETPLDLPLEQTWLFLENTLSTWPPQTQRILAYVLNIHPYDYLQRPLGKKDMKTLDQALSNIPPMRGLRFF